MAIHLGDVAPYRNQPGVIISEPMNLFIEDNFPDASYQGIIGLSGKVGQARPVWIWKKVLVKERVNHIKLKFL